jgi:hypothetical protein
MAKIRTHEMYVASIYALALRGPGLSNDDKRKLRAIKLSYGAGPDGTRGVTYYQRWKPHKCGRGCNGNGKGHAHHKPDEAVPFVAICATGQESHVQVCGTVLHELGHVLAGMGVGHGQVWHDCCARLGLISVRAAGTEYTWDNFDPKIAKQLRRLRLPNDGAPVAPIGSGGAWGGVVPKLKPCGAGWGTKGGKSRGVGSKSRLLLYHCACETPVKIRHSGQHLQAQCLVCNSPFVLQEASLPPSQGGIAALLNMILPPQ